MRHIAILFAVILFVSCTNDNMYMSDNDDDYWSKEQLLNTSGLGLYPFVPFTEAEMRTLPYDVKLERRQIPESFLRNMSTKALFYQFVYTDLSKSMLMFNTMQQGFETVTGQLNMLPELLDRPDAGHVLLEILQKVDPAKINGSDCFWFFDCLQMISAQPEVISSMSDTDIDSYVLQQIRCHDAIRSLAKTDENWSYPESVGGILLGLGNVMFMYEFEPFLQLLEKDPGTNKPVYRGDGMARSEQKALQIIDCAKQFNLQNL